MWRSSLSFCPQIDVVIIWDRGLTLAVACPEVKTCKQSDGHRHKIYLVFRAPTDSPSAFKFLFGVGELVEEQESEPLSLVLFLSSLLFVTRLDLEVLLLGLARLETFPLLVVVSVGGVESCLSVSASLLPVL